MPSEIDATSPDRRTRKREAKRDALLDLAADVVERDGVAGLTMAALAEAADYAPASLYTYFPSRSSLLAAVQQRALVVLAGVAEARLAACNEALAAAVPAPTKRVAALVRLWSFADQFLTAPDHHRREFRLQQQLLVTPGSESAADAAAVVPVAFAVLEVPRRLLDDAVSVRALEAGDQVFDPVGNPIDIAFVRTLSWVSAMNGALLLDWLPTGIPSTGRALGQELTASLLRGWGARPADVAAAIAVWNELDLDHHGGAS